MKLTVVITLLSLFILFGVTGCSTLKHVDYSQLFSRKGWDKPDEVMQKLGIKPGMTIADLGAGYGYFSFEFAKAVGPTGKVYAVELDPERQTALRAEIKRRGITNIVVVNGSVADPLLPDGSVDVAFLCNAYHHFENRPVYFKDLSRDLVAAGRVAILDTKDTSFARFVVPKGHWVTPEQMQNEMHQADYQPLASYDTLPYNSFDVFVVANND